ncbi:MAG: dimethylhistidine N-methyltransferase [Acidobacteria bacterium 13_1_20CM_3_58_11]|nr:MAG: dimethylhistidine N-methyltransferase [Acidobacteria bacterium 13_1_20CM_3_58_11]
MLTSFLPVRHVSEFAADVRQSLTKPGQRELPSKYLYDEVGSALFETICVLPEYGLTRADARLMEKHAGEIVRRLPSPIKVAELGSGSGKKTRWILEALSQRQRTYYYPIEISPSALAACAKELGQIDLVSVVGHEQPYLEGLRTVAEGRGEQDHLLVLFLGSTIGNFDRHAGEEFLKETREILQPGDALLLGTDLEKSVELQILAYDDPAGVTAAFNLNLLARINRELGADFDLCCFRHEARWNNVERRIEMHLRSTRRQTVHVPVASLRFMLNEDETIWTESSHKYKAEEIPQMAERTGFRCDGQWIDRQWPFAQNLLRCPRALPSADTPKRKPPAKAADKSESSKALRSDSSTSTSRFLASSVRPVRACQPAAKSQKASMRQTSRVAQVFCVLSAGRQTARICEP